MQEAPTQPPRVTEDDLAHAFARIEQAAVTLRRQRSPRPMGHGSTWPEVVHEAVDIWHATLTHEASAPRIGSSAEQIRNMDEVLGWMAWLTGAAGRETSKAVWLVASGVSYRKAGRIIGVKSHHTVKSWVESGLYLIAVNFVKK